MRILGSLAGVHALILDPRDHATVLATGVIESYDEFEGGMTYHLIDDRGFKHAVVIGRHRAIHDGRVVDISPI